MQGPFRFLQIQRRFDSPACRDETGRELLATPIRHVFQARLFFLPAHDARSCRHLLVYEKERDAREDEKAFVIRDCYESATFRQMVFEANAST